MQEKITIIGWTLLIMLVVYWTIKIIVNTIKSEKGRKKFSPNMKVGDKVHFPVDSNTVTGKILEVDGDTVKIVVSVSKSRVYPDGLH
jgi:preprotein translocase subunit YajC